MENLKIERKSTTIAVLNMFSVFIKCYYKICLIIFKDLISSSILILCFCLDAKSVKRH